MNTTTEMSKEELENNLFVDELASLGVEIITPEEVTGEFGLALEIDLDTEIDYSSLVEQQFTFKKLTKRKDFFYITLQSYDKEKGRLTLLVGTPINKELFDYYSHAHLPKPVGTNFPDLCWYFAEGTTELTDNEVETKFREDCKMGDLTWYVPSRVVDNFIEIMHTMNQSFLQGLMQETICYGPYLMQNKSAE